MNFPKIEPLEARIAPATISIAGASVTEGNAGTTATNFTVTLSEAATEQITVHFATTDGTAVSTGTFADYEAQSDTVVTFEIGEMSKDVPVQVTGDLFLEGNETFTGTLSNPSGSNTISTGTATGTINNDDAAAVVTISPAADVTEDGSATSVFTVSLSHPVETNATVTYTTGASADSAKPAPGIFTDYIAKTGTVTFTAGGATAQQISVAITDDTYKEDTEQFTVTLSNPTGATLGGGSSAIGKILNDGSDTVVGLHLDDVKHVEGNAANNVTLTPTLSGTLGSNLAFTLSTQNGTAVGGSDFTAATLSPVTITAGTLSKTFNVNVIGDSVFEATENFFVNLNGASGVTVVNDHAVGTGAQATARLYLYNDDVQQLSPTKAQWIDIDGDLVTLTVTKGQLPLTNTTLFTFDTTSSAVGGRILQKLNLAAFPGSFAGTGINITATKQAGFPGTSDGRVDVGFIDAAEFDADELRAFGIDLGVVTVDGDLGKITAGDSFSTPAIAKLDVFSLGARGTTKLPSGDTNIESKVLGPIGSVVVKQNLESYLHVVGAEFGSIGSLKIGGALKGSAANSSGRVAVSGRLGTATVGEIIGGAGDSSGLINALLNSTASLGNITVLGDITGGTGNIAGAIVAPRIGNVMAHDLVGANSGSKTQSGLILSQSTLGNVTLSGDLLGGGVADSGQISSGTTMGAVKIAGKILGGAGEDSGSIQSGGNITSLSVVTITGAAGKGSGSVRVGVDNTGAATSTAANIGAVTITGKDANDDSLKGSSGVNSGRIDVLGSILSFTAAGDIQGGSVSGSGAILSRSTIGAIAIAGKIAGDAGADSGSIQSGGNITSLSVGTITGAAGKGSGSVRVGVSDTGATTNSLASIGAITFLAKDAGTNDSLTGGTGENSGLLDVANNIASIAVKGNVHGAAANSSGSIVAGGNIDKLVISGSLIGAASGASALTTSGAIKASWLKSVAITGDIIAGAKGAGTITSSGSITAQRIDLLTVSGKLTGNATNAVFINATGTLTDLALGTLTVNGAVEFATIRAGYNSTVATSADASIGVVTFGSTVHGLNLIAGTQAGSTDGRFGTNDDVIVTGTGVKNNAAVISRIASVVFKNAQAIIPNEAIFGISAQNVVAITLGTTKIALRPGPGNDRPPAPGTSIEIGTGTKFSVAEVAVP